MPPRGAGPNWPRKRGRPRLPRARACPRRVTHPRAEDDMAEQAEQRTFDDRDGWIWVDGQLVPWRDARVHVLTHALHYASSVFEGQRAYNGVIFKLREHSERL